MSITLLLLVSYFLGSIPFGLLLTKLAGLGDIRQIGSGNIGATNVLRTGNKKIAALTLLCDLLKGSAAVYLAQHIMPEFAGYAGFMALLGHMFPIWLSFKGGKGVATGLGVLVVLAWPVAIMAMLIWLASAWMLRISSLSALISVGTTPIFAIIFGYESILSVLMLMILFIFAKHNANIVRLFMGTEPMIGQKNIHENEDA